jgi:hypothetical protein
VLLDAPTSEKLQVKRDFIKLDSEYKLVGKREREEKLNIKKLLHFVLQKIFSLYEWSRLLD